MYRPRLVIFLFFIVFNNVTHLLLPLRAALSSIFGKLIVITFMVNIVKLRPPYLAKIHNL